MGGENTKLKILSAIFLMLAVVGVASAQTFLVAQINAPLTVQNPFTVASPLVGVDRALGDATDATSCSASGTTISCPSQTVYPGDNVTISFVLSAGGTTPIMPIVQVLGANTTSALYSRVWEAASCTGPIVTGCSGPFQSGLLPVSSAQRICVYVVATIDPSAEVGPLMLSVEVSR